MTPEDELHTYVYTHIDMHIYALTCKHTHTHSHTHDKANKEELSVQMPGTVTVRKSPEIVMQRVRVCG